MTASAIMTSSERVERATPIWPAERRINCTKREFELSSRAESALSLMYDEGGPTMISIRLVIAALATVGLASAPAEAKKYRHHVSPVQLPTQATSGMATTSPRTTYGTSGTPIGTVTAPSIGSYNWPSVGVTNAVPTWKNTNPPVR